jgi:hypothetical protein
VVDFTTASLGAIGFDFRVGQFLAIEPFDLSQLIRSSALRSPLKNAGTEKKTADAAPAARPVLESKTMGGY